MVVPMSLGAAGTLLVVPPMNLLGLAALGTVALFWRPRLGRVLVAAALAGLIVLSMPAVSDALVASLETGLPVTPDPAHPPQAIVILGGDVARRAGDGSDIGALSLERVRAGAALARRTGLPILVTGGITFEGGAPVGQVMADSLRDDFGMAARWTERVSVDTWENAALSAPMLEADGIESVYVVTHGWHMRRSLMAFAPTRLRAVAAPAGFSAGPRWVAESFVPTATGLQRSYYALHEWIGIAWYSLRR